MLTECTILQWVSASLGLLLTVSEALGALNRKYNWCPSIHEAMYNGFLWCFRRNTYDEDDTVSVQLKNIEMIRNAQKD
jgi:hypothetical protein